MRGSILKTMLILPLLMAGAHSATSASVDPAEVYNFWSEDAAGGGSYLGVDTIDITSERVAALQLKEERGVEVTMVDQDAPAGKAGMREHDVILSINGEPVQGVEHLRRMIHEIPPGRNVTIGISRNGEVLTLKAQLAHRKDFSALAPDFKFVMPNLTTTLPELDIPASIVVVHSSARSGLMVENLSPQLSDFFGVKDGQGILVRSVEKGSFADKSGFHAGDVIVRVNGQAVSDSGDFGQALRNRKTNTVNINIVRARKEQTLTLTLPEIKHTGFENVGTQSIGGWRTRKWKSAPLENRNCRQTANQPGGFDRCSQFDDIHPGIEKQVQEQLQHAQEQINESARWECQKEAAQHGRGSRAGKERSTAAKERTGRTEERNSRTAERDARSAK